MRHASRGLENDQAIAKFANDTNVSGVAISIGTWLQK
jgi:hypothetical protein